MIGQFLQRRRATHALARAISQGNLDDMQLAIEQGADMAKVKDSFDEPAQHFQMSYGVQGALQLAIEHRLPMAAFELLLEAGAPVPAKSGNTPDPLALFNAEDRRWVQSDQVIALIESVMVKRAITAHTPASTATPARRPGL